MKYLALLLLLGGCVTPENWKPADHALIMQRCYVMCRKTGAAGYEAFVGECTCNKRRLSE